MEISIFLSAIFLMLMVYGYQYTTSDILVLEKKGIKEWNDKKVIALLIFGGLLFKMVASRHVYNNMSDFNNFKWIGDTVLKSGYQDVFLSGVNLSLPPFMVHIAGLCALFCKFFGFESFDPAASIFFKMPFIVCDIALAVIIYRIARKKVNQKGAIILGVAYLLNPASLVDSSLWGQTDAVGALLVVLMLWMIYQNKTGFGCIAFTGAVLFQPYLVILLPVLLIAIFDSVVVDKEKRKTNIKNIVIGLGISVMEALLICLPVGIGKSWNSVITAYRSLPYATINGYNLWTMLEKNWSPVNTKVGGLTIETISCVIIGICFIGGVVYHYLSRKKDRTSYITLAVYLFVSMFTFGVRMHERYLFAAMGLILLLYAVKPRIENYIFYVVVSFVQFANLLFVFFVYDVSKFRIDEPVPCYISSFIVLSFIAFCIVCVLRLLKGEFKIDNIHVKEKMPFTVKASEKKIPFTKKDFIFLLVIMAVYSVFALRDVGDQHAPETAWTYYAQNETNFSDVDEYAVEGGSNEIIFDLGSQKHVAKIQYFLGNYENRSFQLSVADTKQGPWTKVQDIKMVSVFAWGKQDVNMNSRYIKMTSIDTKASVLELAFNDENSDMVIPINQSECKYLFDEQEMVPERNTFRESTYFDEIYHARTAWEFTKGFPSYENTHPPLGKFIMSIGIRLFGMNPFGWRIMGILIGIGMLPFFYLFSKCFFKESWMAAAATTLFAFDFMHFAQTRIATIDVYVTFFIIITYYYMYKYYKMSFYDTTLKKTFVTLGLCGVTMGLAMASKWTGVYAAAGLCVLFFVTIARRYREYRYAKANPGGYSNGIAHDYIIEKFSKYTIKTILFCVVAFGVVPVVIYTLSYIPFRDYQDCGLVTRMIKNQTTMFTYHQGVTATHPYSSRWWQWPVMYRPIWYYSGHVSGTVSEGISSFGNPLVWWSGIPAFFYIFHHALIKKDRKAAFLVTGYLSQYLPWVLIGRTTFIYHYFTSVPFVTMMVAYALFLLVKEKKMNQNIILIYVFAAVVLFCLFYPVLSGQPVEKNYVSKVLRWFDSWVLVS